MSSPLSHSSFLTLRSMGLALLLVLSLGSRWAELKVSSSALCSCSRLSPAAAAAACFCPAMEKRIELARNGLDANSGDRR